MQRLTTTPAPAAERRDCPPPAHPKLTAFIEAMAMAGAIWDMTGVLATQTMRRLRDDRDDGCEHGEGATR